MERSKAIASRSVVGKVYDYKGVDFSMRSQGSDSVACKLWRDPTYELIM